EYEGRRSRLVEELRTATDAAAARCRIRRQLPHLARPGLASADRRAAAVFRLPGTGGREGHGPLLHAVDLHVAVLPTDWPASPDLLGDVSLPQLRLRRRRRQDQPPQRRGSQNAGLLHSGDGPVVQGHADGLRLAVDHPLPDEHHLLDRLAVQRQALRLSAFLAAGAHEDDLYFATN